MVRKHLMKKNNPFYKYRDNNSAIIYGLHPVIAALGNPKRVIQELFSTVDRIKELKESSEKWPNSAKKALSEFILVTNDELSLILPAGAVHQGLAVIATDLPKNSLNEIIEKKHQNTGPIVVLDQVTDPQNLGAIMRSAAVFGAQGIILQKRNSPSITGSLAKTASGALESVPLIHVTNLARTLSLLKRSGFWIVGLDANSPTELHEALTDAPTTIVLGSEGSGLRRLTSKNCDILAKIPTGFTIQNSYQASMNVSNAAAIALYQHSFSAKK